MARQASANLRQRASAQTAASVTPTNPQTSTSFWKQLSFLIDAVTSHPLWTLLLVLFEVAMSVLIILRVSYTEIDWKAYMQQVSGFLAGERDYARLSGDTGPLVYPAGFLYMYSALHAATQGGKHILLAQTIFAGIYIATLVIIFVIYRHSRLFPLWGLPLLLVSKRIRSIYLLRLFNDPIAMFFMFASVLAILRKRWTVAAVFYSIALSVKMNVLLFAPAFAWIYYNYAGITLSAINAFIVAAIQLLVALPFMITTQTTHNYLTRAFEFTRQFDYKWTVNWRFVPLHTFQSKPFSGILLCSHAALLIVFAATVWQRLLPRKLSKKKIWWMPMYALSSQYDQWIYATLNTVLGTPLQHQPTHHDDADPDYADHVLMILFTSNFIGIVCARSLHYQFYSWYFFTLPYLFWCTSFPLGMRIAMLIAMEWCWNVYPSTVSSSTVLLICHVCLLVGMLIGNRRFVDSRSDASNSKHKKL